MYEWTPNPPGRTPKAEEEEKQEVQDKLVYHLNHHYFK
jgi:hypothetical protein